MHERRRFFVRSYLSSLAVAFAISAASTPFLIFRANGVGLAAGVAVLFGSSLTFGTAFFILSAVRQIVRIPYFGLNILAQTGLILLTVAAASYIVVWLAIAAAVGKSLLNDQVLAIVRKTVWTTDMPLFLVVGTLCAALINSAYQVSRKLGPGVLWNWMTGKYYTPREEERIFMFLDIKESTPLGERLGNLKFSALVRDFFRDITYPVLETKGQVSHFIGDGVVLTWRTEDGLKKGNCIDMYFKLQKVITENKERYLELYGVVPEFKAGLHIGQVVATEVGEIKSEIVFHGDVLNTVARIQALTGTENCNLLLSGDLAARIQVPTGIALRSLGLRKLRGKEREVEILAAEIV